MLTVRVKKSLPKDVKICLPRREKTPYHVVAKSSYRAHMADELNTMASEDLSRIILKQQEQLSRMAYNYEKLLE